jgi:hypothetical protein
MASGPQGSGWPCPRRPTSAPSGQRGLTAPQTSVLAGPPSSDSASQGSEATIPWLLAQVRAELRHPEFALLLGVVATLPLELTKEWFPVQWIELSRIGMFGLIIWTLWSARGARFQAAPFLVVLASAAVLVVEIASVAITRWPVGVHDAIGVIAYTVFALAVAQVVQTRRRLAMIAVVFFASTVVVGAVGIAQEIWNFYLWHSEELDVLGRRNATFRDPNIMSRILIMGALVGYGIAVAMPRARSRWASIALGVGLVVIAIGQITTQSRSGLALAGLMTVVAVAVLFRYRRAVALYAAVFILSLVVGVTILPTIFLRTDGIINSGPAKVGVPTSEVPKLTGAARTILSFLPIDATREYLIQAGVAMFSDHPVVGVGVGGVEPLMDGPYNDYIATDYRSANPTVLMHTEVVRIAAETGIVGLAAFIFFVAALAIVVRRRFKAADPPDRAMITALALGLLTILLSSQLVGRFYSEPYLWLFIGLLCSWALRERARDTAPGAGQPLEQGAST